MVLTRSQRRSDDFSDSSRNIFYQVRSRKRKHVNPVLREAGFKMISVPGDGHCLLHALIKSWSHQIVSDSAPSLNALKALFIDEITYKKERYLPFCGTSPAAFIGLAHSYIISKTYNNTFCDVIPLILANMLSVTIHIMDDLNSNMQFFDIVPDNKLSKHSIYLYRTGDHYNALSLTKIVPSIRKTAVNPHGIMTTNSFSALVEEECGASPGHPTNTDYDDAFPILSIGTTVRKDRWVYRSQHKRTKTLSNVHVQHVPPPNRNVPSNTHRNPPTIVIGTSQVRNLGLALNRSGVDAIAYSNGGCSIHHIAPRIKHMIPAGFDGQVVLQVGGNDISSMLTEDVIQRYDSLLNDVFKHAPKCHVFTCAIPTRQHVLFDYKRHVVNDHLHFTSLFTNRMTFIDCPDYNSSHFKRDKIHLNTNGFCLYVSKVCSHLKPGFHMANSPISVR